MKKIQVVLLAIFAASLSANGYTGELTCNLCIDIVKAVEDFLEDGHNQEDIIAIAEAVLIFYFIFDQYVVRC